MNKKRAPSLTDASSLDKNKIKTNPTAVSSWHAHTPEYKSIYLQIQYHDPIAAGTESNCSQQLQLKPASDETGKARAGEVAHTDWSRENASTSAWSGVGQMAAGPCGGNASTSAQSGPSGPCWRERRAGQEQEQDWVCEAYAADQVGVPESLCARLNKSASITRHI